MRPPRLAGGAAQKRDFTSGVSSAVSPPAQVLPRLVWVSGPVLDLDAARAEVTTADAARRHRPGREEEHRILQALVRLLNDRVAMMREMRP
jgi:hypothetical protein